MYYESGRHESGLNPLRCDGNPCHLAILYANIQMHSEVSGILYRCMLTVLVEPFRFDFPTARFGRLENIHRFSFGAAKGVQIVQIVIHAPSLDQHSQILSIREDSINLLNVLKHFSHLWHLHIMPG